MNVEYQQKRLNRVCFWARKIHSKYPNHPLIHNWTLNLKEVLYENRPLNCETSYKEQKKRIQHLQFSGEQTRAEEEIKERRKQILSKNKKEKEELRLSVAKGLSSLSNTKGKKQRKHLKQRIKQREREREKREKKKILQKSLRIRQSSRPLSHLPRLS